MNPGGKGQASVEFMIVAVLLLILFGIVLYTFGQRNSYFNIDSERLEAEMAARQVSMAVGNVHAAGNGAEMELALTQKDMNFDAAGGSIRVFYGNGIELYPVPTKAVRSEVIPLPETIRISNNNGVIEIAPA